MYNLKDSEKRKIIERMYTDIFFFAKIILGDETQPMHYHVRDETPTFHREIIANLMKLKTGEKMAVVAPRGHAKSTLISLIYPLHRILFGEEHFLLMISESEMQSKYLLEALGDEIEFNEKLHYFFGNRIGRVWGKEEKEVITGFDQYMQPTGTCKILIRGTGQKVRGLRYGAYRPTLTIIDDGEGDANTATPAQRDKFRRWLDTAVIPGSDDAKLIFVGTIIDEEAYLNKIAGTKAYTKEGKYRAKGWKSLFYQAILQDTKKGMFSSSGKEIVDKKGTPKVLWPKRRPYKWLDGRREELKSQGDVAYFYQEYQNMPMDDSFRTFKKDDLRYWEGYYLYEQGHSFISRRDNGLKEKIPVNIFVGVDPASSENIKADYTVIMVIAVDADYNIYVLDYFRGQVAPMDGAEKLFDICEQYQPKEIKIEETGHVMLADYVRRRSKEMGKFWNINPKKAIKTKFYRIKQMQPHFASHAVFMKEEHFDLESELLAFREHGTFKKDTLDALRWAIDDMYAPSATLDNQGDLVISNMVTGSDWETGRLYYAET